MKIYPLSETLATCLFILLNACSGQSQNKHMDAPRPVAVNEAKPCSRLYKFDGTWYDLETCKQADLGGKGLDFKDCSPYGFQFSPHLQDTVVYKNHFFAVSKNYQLVIDARQSSPSKKIKLPVADPLPEVHEYYFNLMATTGGVVVIMEDYYGTEFTVLKYDENGKELARSVFDHTFITHPEPNTNEYHRYLYLGYITPTQLIFTSHMAFGEKDKTIVLELKDLAKKEYGHKISGIVLDENQQYAKGFLSHQDSTFTVKFPGAGKEMHFTIPYGDGACTTILKDNQLVVANYHPIATGSSLYAFDVNTGQRIWKADVKQVNASHSEYFNKVYLSLYKNTIVMEGREAYGHYLQFFDWHSGKRLACHGILDLGDK